MLEELGFTTRLLRILLALRLRGGCAIRTAHAMAADRRVDVAARRMRLGIRLFVPRGVGASGKKKRCTEDRQEFLHGKLQYCDCPVVVGKRAFYAASSIHPLRANQ